MGVSIIIPAYNAGNTLAACLDACIQQTLTPAEIIVVDDGSTDDTIEVARSFAIKCLRQQRQGPAAARNAGWRMAHGEFVAFTDADCIPRHDWLERLMECFADPTGGVGGAYSNANPESLLACMIQEEIAIRHARFDQEVDFLGSFNVMYRRAAIEAVGGFDEQFSAASGEDNDLAYRLADAGWKLHFTPDAVVAHHHPSRLRPYLSTQMRHGYWRMKLYKKHPNRARGDHYAGLADFAAPPLSIIFLAFILGLPLAFLLPGNLLFTYAVIGGLCSLVYLAIRLPMPLQMIRRTGRMRMFEFGDVAFLRDLARAAGMMMGIWHFFIRRKEQA